MLRNFGKSGRRIPVSVAVIAILGACLGGCSSSRPVTMTNQDRMLEEIKQKTASDEAVLELTNGEQLKATMIFGDTDTLHYTDPDHRTQARVATHDVSRITLVSHGRGAGQGLGIGALAGAALGGAAGYADGDDPSGFVSFSAGAKAGMGAAGGALVGGLLGLAVGGASGSSIVYDFEDFHFEPAERDALKTGESPPRHRKEYARRR